MEDENFTFPEVQEAYRVAQDSHPFFAGMTLKDFSQFMNQQTSSLRYSAGNISMPGRLAKQYSTGVENVLQPFKEYAGALGEKAGGGLGSLFNQEEVGREIGKSVGEGLPRTAAEVGAMAIPYVGVPTAMADVFSKGYTETGSPLVGAIQAGTFGAAPLVGGKAAAIASRLPIAQTVGETVGPGLTGLLERGAEKAASTVGLLGTFEAGGEASSLAQEQGLYNPLEPRHVAETLANILPFEVAGLPSALRGYKTGPEGRIKPAGWQDVLKPTIPGQVRSLAEGRSLSQAAVDAAAAYAAEVAANRKATVVTSLRGQEESFQPPEDFEPPESVVLKPKEIEQFKLNLPGPEVAPAFLPEQLQGGAFGRIVDEQLNEEKPFKLSRLPGDKLPGNSLLERLPRALPPDEWEMLKGSGIEEFLKGKTVPIKEFQDWLASNGPRVEVKIVGNEIQTPERKEFLQIEHKLDTITPYWRREAPEDLARRSPEALGLLARYHELGSGTQVGPTPSTSWQSIAPKPKNEMPGYVEGAVVIPERPFSQQKLGGSTLADRGVMFPPSHNFPPNTLVFWRGYWEQVGARKVFHVIEVQSDWGQQLREAKENALSSGAEHPYVGVQNHPLLKDTNHLALKSAIDYAIKNGADAIAISDAETAMMTEGHDRLAASQGRLLGSVERPAQEKGMRLNYNEALPRIAGDLTGAKGERVSFGPHKNAFANAASREEAIIGSAPQYRNDLVFQNPDKTPKIDVTATMFPLDKVKQELLRRGGFTLFGKDKILSEVMKAAAEGRETETLGQMALELGRHPIKLGESIADVAARESGLDLVINQPNDPKLYLPKVQDFFTRYFTLKGETGPRLNYLTKNALGIAARFEHITGRTGIADAMTGAANFAVSPRDSKWNGFVGLVTGSRGHSNLPTEFFHALWDWGHELVHQVQFRATAMLSTGSPIVPDWATAYNTALQSANAMTTEEKGIALRAMLFQIAPRDISRKELEYRADLYQKYAIKQGQTYSSAEFLSDYGGLLAMAHLNPRGARDAWFFGDRAEQDLSKGFYVDLTQTISAVKDYFQKVMSGTGAKDLVVKQASAYLESVHKNMVSIMKTDAEVKAAVDAFTALSDRGQVGPVDPPPRATYQQVAQMGERMARMYDFGLAGAPLKDEVERVVDEADKMMIPQSVGGKRPSKHELLFPLGQFVKAYPEATGIADVAADFRRMASANVTQLFQYLTEDNGKFAKDRLRSLGREETMANDALNFVKLFQNTEVKQFVGSELKEMLKKKFPSLSDKDLAAIDRTNQQFGQANVASAFQRLQMFRDRLSAKAGMIVQQYDPTADHVKAKGVAKEAMDFLMTRFNLPPAEQSIGLAQLASRMDPKMFDSLFKFAENNKDSYLKMQETLLGADGKGKPYYSPEVRTGKWLIAWKETDGERQLWDFKTQVEANKKYADLQRQQAEGKLAYLKAFNSGDNAERYQGMQGEMLDSYIEADNKLFNATIQALKEGGADEATLDRVREDFKPGEGAIQSSVSPYMRERSFVGGRERLNMLEGNIRYLNSTSYGLSRSYVKGMIPLVVNSPKLKANPALQNIAQRYLTNLVDSSGSEFNKLNGLIFMNFLGGNPSSLPIVMTHQLTTLAPHLVELGATLREAYFKYLLPAIQDVGGSYFRKGQFLNPEENAAIQKARLDGDINKGFVSDIQSYEDEEFRDRINLIDGPVATVARKLIFNPLYHATKFGRDFFGLATMFNSTTAFLASYRMARERGMPPSEAHSFAVEAVRTTMGGGGKANRSILVNSLGRFQGVGGTMLALQGYTLNVYGMAMRLTKDALGRSGLPETERAQAGKALGTMFATQAMIGGVFGLPFVAATVALVDQIFPQAEVKKRLRGMFASLGGDNLEMGHIISDGAMHGLFNTVGPADIGSRFELGHILGVDPNEGFSWSNLGGPLTSVLSNYVQGFQLAQRGRTGEAVEKALPAGVRGLYRLYNDGGNVLDSQDRLIFKPTPAEQALIAVGFKPKRLSQFYEEQDIHKRAEILESQRLHDFHSDLADKLLAGDIGAVRAGLMSQQTETPNYDPREALKQVVEIAQEKSIPANPLRTGGRTTAAETSRIQTLYPQIQGEPTEMQRLLQRTQIERSVGVPGTGMIHPGEMRMAQMVDQLMAMQPRLSRPEARVMVEKQLGRLRTLVF